MADIVDNKHDISTTWGDTDVLQNRLGSDNDSNFGADSSGIPKVDSNNKHEGVSDPSESNKSEMNMSLEPNKFPRETTTGGLSDDDLVHT